MKKCIMLLLLTLFCSGCFAAKPPAWLVSGHKYLEMFKEDYLADKEPATTEIHFRKSLEQIKNGGDLDLLAKAWLNRMALQIAVLEEPASEDYKQITAAAPTPANDNFFLFLTENSAAVDVSLLPEAYRPFEEALRTKNTTIIAETIFNIKDPLSRLVASGLAVRNNLYDEELITAAVKTASEKGWKRALLVWLERLKIFYATTRKVEKAAAISRRLELLR